MQQARHDGREARRLCLLLLVLCGCVIRGCLLLLLSSLATDQPVCLLLFSRVCERLRYAVLRRRASGRLRRTESLLAPMEVQHCVVACY